MSEVMKCDACGTVYEKEYKNICIEEKWVNGANLNKYDLCPACIERFHRWLDRATEEAFDYLKADWIARQILADLAGMSVNDTTNTLTTKIIFGNDKKPQKQFHYRNLADLQIRKRLPQKTMVRL